MENKKITRESVTGELTRSIKMWLNLSNEQAEKFKQYKGHDYDAENCQMLSFSYHSMAQALYLSGKTLGITFDDEIQKEF